MMGTRAQFFIGDPRDVANRVWLGTVAWDGYPAGDCGDALCGRNTEAEFRAAVELLAGQRDDFCDPEKNSFPFPWRDDLFLTDCTYALFDGEVQFTYFHRGFVPLAKYLAFTEDEREEYGNSGDRLPSKCPAPEGIGEPGPDSILEAKPEHDEHDIAVGVVIGLDLAFLEGRVVELIAEARNASGAARVAALRKAERYLAQACLQAEGGAR